MHNFNTYSSQKTSEARQPRLCCLSAVFHYRAYSHLLSPSSPSFCDVFSSTHTLRGAANAARSLSRAHTRARTHTPHTACGSPANIGSRVSPSLSTQTSQTSRSRSAFWAFPSSPVILTGWCLGCDSGWRIRASWSQPVPAHEMSLGW